MANWSKRRSKKIGSQGQRRTYTTSSTGKITNSYSSKVGNRRTTTSMSGGKIKQTVTETHPTLGRRTTTKTLTPAYKPPKKPRKRKAKPFKFSTNKSKRVNTGTSWWNEPDNSSPSTFWIVVAVILVLIWIFG